MKKRRGRKSGSQRPPEQPVEIEVHRDDEFTQVEVEEGWVFRAAFGQRDPRDPKSLTESVVWFIKRMFTSFLPKGDVTIAKGKRVVIGAGQSEVTARRSHDGRPNHRESEEETQKAIEDALAKNEALDGASASARDAVERSPASEEEIVRLRQELRKELDLLRREGGRIELRSPDDEEESGDGGS